MFTTFRLGVFIVATLVILCAGVFLIGGNQFRFRSTYPLKAEFENVAGLIEGANVNVGGIHKGTVKRIVLPSRPDGKVTVVMHLESETRDVVKKDSMASIKSEGLLGDKFVEISFGSQDAERLQDSDTIRSEPPLEFSHLVKKASEILDSTKDAVQNAEEATGDLKSITATISQGKGTVGALIKDRKVYDEASAGATAFKENMDALKSNFLLRGFFNKRGYKDSSELTRHEIARPPASPAMKTFSYDAKKIFDKTDTAKLKNEKVLNEAGTFLSQNRFGVAVVAASAGPTGDSDEKRVLTQARATVVRDFLVERFPLDDTRLRTLGLGKTRETADDGKIEILVYPAGVKVPPAVQKQVPR